jgi:hypothetical protein
MRTPFIGRLVSPRRTAAYIFSCERILAEDFLFTSARGVLMPKSQWLETAMGSFVCESFEWEDVRVRPFGDMANNSLEADRAHGILPLRRSSNPGRA